MRIVFTIFLLFSLKGFSQSFTGRVVDSKTNQPLESATLLVKNGQATLSDKEGYFSISAKPGDSLFISCIGHQTLTHCLGTQQQSLLFQLIPSGLSLKEIVVKASLGNALLSNFHKIDLTTRPLNNSQEILRLVPGLFIGQHAGGGKAEQLFLRGFDVDHGTDVAISTDGLPVNMPSHAHGQGYADLHFVIPETIEKIDFGKGPYYVEKGDFNTAGYVSLHTYDRISNNQFRVESGLFNTLRTVGLFNLIKPTAAQNAYVAGEAYLTDGPFDASQQFRRSNFFVKHQYHFNTSTLTTQASRFSSRWLASGQIPERAVEDGQIGWFGAIDPNEGGQTSRTNLSTQLLTKLANGSKLEQQLYFSKYKFELYSNFTFFKNDPLHGDEIRQKESRTLFGYNGSFTKDRQFEGQISTQFKAGLVFRTDIVNDLELSRTYQRSMVTSPRAFGKVIEQATSAYISQTYRTPKWNLNMGLRMEHFQFQYRDDLHAQPNQAIGKSLLNPKLNIQYQLAPSVALYLKTGRGFHSNDARVVIPQNGVHILPTAWGSDLGVVFKSSDRLIINTCLWLLKLDQEFVYVGDEAVVEPGDQTLRKGFDFSLRYEISKKLFADLDLNYTLGRSLEAPVGAQYLPLAPRFSSTGGLTYIGERWNAGLRYRWLGDRPANETNSEVAKGYCIGESQISYRLNSKCSLGLVADNLFNVKWKETQFLTESRLSNEMAPVEEIHFTPGTPFFLKARVTVEF